MIIKHDIEIYELKAEVAKLKHDIKVTRDGNWQSKLSHFTHLVHCYQNILYRFARKLHQGLNIKLILSFIE